MGPHDRAHEWDPIEGDIACGWLGEKDGFFQGVIIEKSFTKELDEWFVVIEQRISRHPSQNQRRKFPSKSVMVMVKVEGV